jgi:serine protease Do
MRKHLLITAALLGSFGAIALLPTHHVAADPVKDAEQDRINTIKRVRPAVVAVYIKDFGGDPRGVIAGGGSGVIIDKEGYALTNFHVVDGGPAGVRPCFACGLPNGVMYDAVCVGVDKMGDVALLKLFPKKAGEAFPFA